MKRLSNSYDAHRIIKSLNHGVSHNKRNKCPRAIWTGRRKALEL